jgi:hypothetical protein
VGLFVGRKEKAPRKALFHCVSGGKGGIRTLGTLARTPDFESGTFDHSATFPVSGFAAFFKEQQSIKL